MSARTSIKINTEIRLALKKIKIPRDRNTTATHIVTIHTYTYIHTSELSIVKTLWWKNHFLTGHMHGWQAGHTHTRYDVRALGPERFSYRRRTSRAIYKIC